MSLILIGVLNAQAAGGGGAAYWGLVRENVDVSSSYGLGISGYAGQALITGWDGNINLNAGGWYVLVDTDGSILYQNTIQSTSGDLRTYGESAILNANGATLLARDEISGNSDLLFVNLNADGSISSQTGTGLGTGGSNNANPRHFATDGSNIYLTQAEYSTGTDMTLVKLNLSGSIQAKTRFIGRSSPNQGSLGLGTNYIFAAAYYVETINVFATGLMRFDYNLSEVSTVNVDSNGYSGGEAIADGDYGVFTWTGQTADQVQRLARLTPTFGLDWAREFSLAGNDLFRGKIAIGPSGDYYVCLSGSSYINLVRIQSNGTVVYQKQIDIAHTTNTIVNERVEALSVDENEDVYLSGTFGNGSEYQPFAMKLPGDGSVSSISAGDYTFTISSGAMTISSITPTLTSVTVTDRSSSLNNVSKAAGTAVDTSTYVLGTA